MMTLMFSTMLLFCDSTSHYGVTSSLHKTESKNSMKENLNRALSNKTKFTKKIQEIVGFMENFKKLSEQQKEEAKQFQLYVNRHIESIASCKNLEDDFNVDMQEGISKEEEELYIDEIEECHEDLASNSISYTSAERFFNEALTTLNSLKIKNKMAAKRHKRLKKSLKEVSALVNYLKVSSQ